MSRSYKKNTFCKKAEKHEKNLANRKVRRHKDHLPQGKQYRKIYNSYDICEYISRETDYSRQKSFESDLQSYINGALDYDPRDAKYTRWHNKNYWEKYYKRK